MKKEFKVNGKVTYPQGVASRTTYTLIDDVGNMINLNADIDTDFDYGDAVILTVTKKGEAKADTSEAPTTVDPVTGSVTAGDTTTTAKTDTSADTDKSDAATTADATTATADSQAASTAATTETEAK
ncbi:hypothetical protein [Megasphaera elsdenii]|uniref:hypothetical protein n=1 Tax=Megasphaera elsdenii TaxID=907 RepID=UPI00351FF3DC